MRPVVLLFAALIIHARAQSNVTDIRGNICRGNQDTALQLLSAANETEAGTVRVIIQAGGEAFDVVDSVGGTIERVLHRIGLTVAQVPVGAVAGLPEAPGFVDCYWDAEVYSESLAEEAAAAATDAADAALEAGPATTGSGCLAASEPMVMAGGRARLLYIGQGLNNSHAELQGSDVWTLSLQAAAVAVPQCAGAAICALARSVGGRVGLAREARATAIPVLGCGGTGRLAMLATAANRVLYDVASNRHGGDVLLLEEVEDGGTGLFSKLLNSLAASRAPLLVAGRHLRSSTPGTEPPGVLVRTAQLPGGEVQLRQLGEHAVYGYAQGNASSSQEVAGTMAGRVAQYLSVMPHASAKDALESAADAPFLRPRCEPGRPPAAYGELVDVWYQNPSSSNNSGSGGGRGVSREHVIGLRELMVFSHPVESIEDAVRLYGSSGPGTILSVDAVDAGGWCSAFVIRGEMAQADPWRYSRTVACMFPDPSAPGYRSNATGEAMAFPQRPQDGFWSPCREFDHCPLAEIFAGLGVSLAAAQPPAALVSTAAGEASLVLAFSEVVFGVRRLQLCVDPPHAGTLVTEIVAAPDDPTIFIANLQVQGSYQGAMRLQLCNSENLFDLVGQGLAFMPEIELVQTARAPVVSPLDVVYKSKLDSFINDVLEDVASSRQ